MVCRLMRSMPATWRGGGVPGVQERRGAPRVEWAYRAARVDCGGARVDCRGARVDCRGARVGPCKIPSKCPGRLRSICRGLEEGWTRGSPCLEATAPGGYRGYRGYRSKQSWVGCPRMLLPCWEQAGPRGLLWGRKPLQVDQAECRQGHIGGASNIAYILVCLVV